MILLFERQTEPFPSPTFSSIPRAWDNDWGHFTTYAYPVHGFSVRVLSGNWRERTAVQFHAFELNHCRAEAAVNPER